MLNSNRSIMFGPKAVFLLSLVINVFLVNGYQDDGNLDGRLEVLLKRLQERLEDEERGFGSMSGIEIDPEVSEIFNEMKLRSVKKWVTFKIENKKIVVIDQTDVPRGMDEDKAQFNEMEAKLTSEPRYILFDFQFESRRDGREINKIAFIFWCDDGAKIGDKMIYASTKDTVKKAFSGLSLEFQANDKNEMNYETFRAEVERKA